MYATGVVSVARFVVSYYIFYWSTVCVKGVVSVLRFVVSYYIFYWPTVCVTGVVSVLRFVVSYYIFYWSTVCVKGVVSVLRFVVSYYIFYWPTMYVTVMVSIVRFFFQITPYNSHGKKLNSCLGCLIFSSLSRPWRGGGCKVSKLKVVAIVMCHFGCSMVDCRQATIT